MAKDVSVNVGLLIEGHVIDLRVPRKVRKGHLKRVIVEALQMMKINIATDFDLRLCGKPLEVSQLALLDDYPIGDGDQIEIVLKGRSAACKK